MGKQLVSTDILHEMLSTSSKLCHGLTYSDLNPRDHQNFSSCFKLCRDEVFQSLSSIDNSGAVSVYLTLLRSIIDAYIEPSTALLDRVFNAWLSVFLSRLWLIWIDKMGKVILDRILVELIDSSENYGLTERKTCQQYFLTPPTVYSIELNAHSLPYLLLLVVEDKLPPEVLSINQFNSQSCESIFRAARAFSSNSSCGVNFTVQRFLNIADKLSMFEKLKNENQQRTSHQIRFPIHHKIKYNPSSSTEMSSTPNIPTKSMIKKIICQAFTKAIQHMDRVEIRSILDEFNLCDISTMSGYAKMLFEDKQILDEFSQENDDIDEVFNYQPDDDSDEDDDSFLEYLNDSDGREPTFRAKRICDDVPSNLLSSYFKIRISDKDKFIHKSTACWLLTDQNQKLSSDRTRRVTQTK